MDTVLFSGLFLLTLTIRFSNASLVLTSSSDKATVGVDFTFTCTANVVYLYFRRGTKSECLIIGVHPNGTCNFGGYYNPEYTYDCDNSNGVYKLTIPSSFDIDTLHGSEWKCSNAQSGDESKPILLYVYASLVLTSSSDKATVGVDFTFTCTTNVPYLYFRRGTQSECLIIGGYPNGTCIFGGYYNTNYTYDCNNSTGVYKLTIPSSFDIVTLHGRNWKCSDAQSGDASEPISLYVYVPITKVVITTIPTDKNPIEIISDRNQLFNCKTNAGRPSSRIQWYISSTNITGSASPQIDDCNSSCNGTVISSSNMTYRGSIADKGKILYCTAVNTEGQIVRSENKSIVIWYPPTSPSITQIPKGAVDENEQIILTCEILGGNPLANIVWQCDGSSLVTPTSVPTTNKSVSIVQLTASQSYNGQICTCTGSHPAWTQTKSSTITLPIRYAPTSSPAVIQTPSGPVMDGTKVTLTCDISDGNPLPTLSWQCDDFTYIIPTANSPTDKVVSSIERIVTKVDDGKECVCTGQHPLWTLDMEFKHIMNVYYPPTTTPTIYQTPPGHVYQGSTITLTCEIEGGNPLANITWMCNGSSHATESSTTDTAISNILLTVTKDHNGGICTCFGSHPGWTQYQLSNFQLLVIYAPSSSILISHTPVGPLIEGYKVTLTCEVFGGNPLASIAWQCIGFTNVTSSESQNTNKAVSSVESTTTKVYNGRECTCTGTHLLWTQEKSETFIFNVYFKPLLDNTKPVSPSYISAIENNILQITLTITANPIPNIEWTFKAEANWCSCNLSSIVSNTTTDGFLTSSSILIDNVHSSNFGDYFFTANNTGGIFFRRFVVIKEEFSKQETCAYSPENTGIFVVGIVTLVVGLLSLTASVIFIVQNSFKNKALESSKSDEYTNAKRATNPAFTDEYSTLELDMEIRTPQEQSSNTYEECERKPETHPYSNVNAKGSEPKQPQDYGINTYDECVRNFEAHDYDTLDK